MFEVCDYVHQDGKICGGLFDPNIDPPVNCIFPEAEAARCIEEIANLEPALVT